MMDIPRNYNALGDPVCKPWPKEGVVIETKRLDITWGRHGTADPVMQRRAALRTKLDFIRRGGNVKRFHTEPMLMENTVAHHSFGVAWLAMVLTETWELGPRYCALRGAIEHDIAEHKLGDVPAPAKRALGIREQFALAEEAAMQAAGVLPLVLDPAAARIVKLADAMDGALHCVLERSMGNQRIAGAFANFIRYIDELAPAEGVEQDLVAYINEEWEKYDG